MRGFDVDGFFIAVVNGADGAAFKDAPGCGFGCVFAGFFVEGAVFGEGGFEGRGQCVAAQKGYFANQVVAGV